MCRLLLVAISAFLIGAQDDAQINAWIADLAHPEPDRVNAAEKGLIKAGLKALPALKAAFESKTPELATRAKAVAAEIERIEFEKGYDKTQRPRRLEIVTLQLKDTPLSEALKTLGSQVDSTFHTQGVDVKQKLTLDVKDVPLRKCLDQMEELLKATVVSRPTWHKVSSGAPPKRKRAYVPGVTFDFSLVPFKPGGQPNGWSLMTDQSGTARVFVDSFEAFDKTKAPVEVERCGRCSPRFVHLKTDREGPFTIKLKGRLVWESPYELNVADPSRTQEFKVGAFAVKYQYPRVTWASTESFPAHLVGRAELAGKLKKQAQAPGVSGPMGTTVIPPSPRPVQTWCECVGGPTPLQAAPAVKISGGTHFESAFQTRKPADFDSIKVRFFKAIEEPFEAEALVPAD